MDRVDIINRIGREYHTANIENGEYSYPKAAGSREALAELMGYMPEHLYVDIRFAMNDVVVLVDTKQHYTESDMPQLAEYVAEERAVHGTNKIIGIFANTGDDEIHVWKSEIDDGHLLPDETVLDSMQHYVRLFDTARQNDKEKVMKNTYDLNELLHKMDISEGVRSQFVGTTLLYIKDCVRQSGASRVDDGLISELHGVWSRLSSTQIRAGIGDTLAALLDGSENKEKKIELLQKNVLDDQKVRALTAQNWVRVLDFILKNIYRYIDADSSEGQDILNLFFIAFNKYTGKADKNQAFTPDHITEFMCRLTDVDRTKVVLDATCGSGSFLVQAMVKELADCRRGRTDAEAGQLMEAVKKQHIFGIEIEEKAYGLSTTNMLIHGDGNSNIRFGSCFDNAEFIRDADPDIILMNPPYNAKPITIPDAYKAGWGKAADGKEDPTKGLVFVHYLSDIIKGMNEDREHDGQPPKHVKMAVLLPVSAAIGTKSVITNEKTALLRDNTLEAVFTLPNEIFYPGASACACCMLFTLGQPHVKADGTPRATFFGYCKDDGFKKKKNLGRVEQFDADGMSMWKPTEEEWLRLFEMRQAVDGESAVACVDGNAEWLCEAYMETDYTKLTEQDFQNVVNDYLGYLVKEGRVHEP